MTEWGNRILNSFVEQVREDVEGLLTERHLLLKDCESPIERAFGAAFMLIHGYFRGKPMIQAGLAVTEQAPQQFIQPQFLSQEGFRADFLIGWNHGRHDQTSIVVECDGHAFHERTKEQAARDKSRDRSLSYRDPCGCAVEAFGISDQLFWDYMLRKEDQG